MTNKRRYVLIFLVGLGAIGPFLGFFTFYAAAHGDAYKSSINSLHENLCMREELGRIQSTRLSFLHYWIEESGVSGEAEFKVHVQGDHRKGLVYLQAVKTLGQWTLKNAILEKADSGEKHRADLLEEECLQPGGHRMNSKLTNRKNGGLAIRVDMR